MDRHNCTDTISGATLSSALPLSWHGWLEDGKRLLVAEIKRTVATIKLWQYRARSRHQLRELDAHLRQDIGLTSQQITRETAKPFWVE